MHNDVDAVYIATPTAIPEKIMIMVAIHGRHVFCENQLALILAMLQAM